MSQWHDEIVHIHEMALKNSGIRPWSTEDVRFLTLALCGEAGELANMIKKEWRADIWPPTRSDIANELCDIVVYAYLLEVALGFDIDSIVEAKLPEIRNKFAQESRKEPANENTGGSG